MRTASQRLGANGRSCTGYIGRLVALVGVLSAGTAVLPAAVFAAGEPPELPVTESCSVFITPTRVCGKLNPNASAKVGYHFTYNKGASCEGGDRTPEGSEVEGQAIEVSGELFALEPSTVYTYCVVATNAYGATPGSGLSFETAPAHSGPPEQPITEACGPIRLGMNPLCGTLNPHMHAKVGYHFEYNKGDSCKGGFQTSGGDEVEGMAIPVSVEAVGLEPNTYYAYCLVATNSSGGEAYGQPFPLKTPSDPPTVVGEEAQLAGPAAAVLRAQIDPENEEVSYYFRYSSEESFKGTEVLLPTGELAAALGLQPVSASIEGGLAPNTTYYYQAVADNVGGWSAGQVKSFTTSALAPVVTTGPVEGVGQSTATLTGRIDPLNASTSYWFQYGASEAYGASVPGANPVAGTSAVVETAGVAGFTPGATYHYRLVASSLGGTAYGADRTFTTAALTQPSPSLSSTVLGPPIAVIAPTTTRLVRGKVSKGAKKHTLKAHRKHHKKTRKHCEKVRHKRGKSHGLKK